MLSGGGDYSSMSDPLTVGILGTLSQGLCDHLFKIVVEKAQSTVKKPLVKRGLEQALVRTEERFKAITQMKIFIRRYYLVPFTTCHL